MKNKLLRRPVVLVGAACTSVLVGVFVFERFLPHHHSPPAPQLVRNLFSSSCGNVSKLPSYVRLQKHEDSRTVKGSVFNRVDVIHLESNSPIEDRFSVGMSENLNAALFSVLDGHKGYNCSHHLQKNLNKHISQSLHAEAGIVDDLRTVMEMYGRNKRPSKAERDGGTAAADIVLSEQEEARGGGVKLDADVLKERLKNSFVSVDREMSDSALNAVRLFQTGHTMTAEMMSTIMTAMDGACALTAILRNDAITVASTGDCRVVLGSRAAPHKQWETHALTTDQNAQNKQEVKRLISAHPGEEGTVIVQDRVLGGLQPFRSFGDVDYKWEKKYLKGIVSMLLPNYKTPPYVTAEPVMTQRKLAKGDRFLIVATDGLWDQLTNEEAVKIVGKFVSSSCENGKGVPLCCDENAATWLLWHALGGDDDVVTKLLDIPAGKSRMYRDDITIMVVHL